MKYNIKYIKFNQIGGLLSDYDVVTIIKGKKQAERTLKILHIQKQNDDNEDKIKLQAIIKEQINDDMGSIILTSFLDQYIMVTSEDVCNVVKQQLPAGKRFYDVPVDGDCGFACILLKLIFDRNLDFEKFKQLSNVNLVPPHATSLKDDTIIKFNNTSSKYCELSENTRCFPRLLINSLRSILMPPPSDESNRGRYIDFADIIKFMQIFEYKVDITIYEKYNHDNNDYEYDYNNSSIPSFSFFIESSKIDTSEFKNSIKLFFIKPEAGEDNSGSHYVLIDDDIHQPLYDELFPALGSDSQCQNHLNNIKYKDFCARYGTIKHPIIELIKQCNQ